MKSTQKKSRSNPDIQSRSKWMMGSAAVVGAAAASTSHAGTVQITLQNNQTSLQGPRFLSADVTGDGIPDFNSFNTGSRSLYDVSSFFATIDYRMRASFSGGQIANVFYLFQRLSPGNSNTDYSARIGSFAGSSVSTFSRGDDPLDLTQLVPVTFSDSRINQGAATNGFLQVRCINNAKNDPSIRFLRTVFDDASVAAPQVELVANYPEFVPPANNVAEKSRLSRKIKKLKKKIRKTTSVTAKARLKKKLKKLQKKLRAL